MKRLKRIISMLLVIVMSVVSIGVSAPTPVTANTGMITIYFMDETAEGWIADDSAVIEMVDNTNGQTRYIMTTNDNKVWSAEVPASANNITFNRYNNEKTVIWNSWSAGGRDGKVTYQAEGTSNGRWTEEQEIQKEITVYFYSPKGWSNPYLYYYNDSNVPKAWPGVQMEAVEGEEGWFTYTIQNRTETKVIFSNNGNEQIPGENEEGYSVTGTMWYRDGQWSSKQPNDITIHMYKPDAWDQAYLYYYKTPQETGAAWPGTQMESEGDGWYRSTITEWNDAKIIFNNGENQQIPARNEEGFLVQGEKWYMDGVFFDEKPEDIIVHFKKPSNWDTPSIYYYKTEQDTGPEWPGETMRHEYKDWYSFRISKYVSAKVVFHDGTNQIPNRLEAGFEVTGEQWYQDGTWYQENPDPEFYEDSEHVAITNDTIPEFLSAEDLLANGHIGRIVHQEMSDNSLIFRNQDGTKTMYMYEDDIKYQDEQGIVHDKSNELTNEISDTTYKKDYAYVNADNDINAYYPKELGEDTGVVLTYEEGTIELSPVTEETALVEKVEIEREGSADAVAYEEIFGEGTSVCYTPEFNGFKEDIVLKENTGENEFSFKLKTNGLRLVENEGSYSLINPITEEEVFALGEIVVYDSRGAEIALQEAETYHHRYEITTVSNEEEYLVTLVIDRNYLDNPATVYPVTIDPAVISTRTKNIEDMTLFQSTNGRTNAGSLHVGAYKKLYGGSHNKARGYVRFPGLFTDATLKHIQADEIVSAYYVPRCIQRISGTTIKAYRAKKTWKENSSYSTSLWEAKDTKVLDSHTVTVNTGTKKDGTKSKTATENNFFLFDITKAAKDWKNGIYGGTTNHYGIMLVASDEANKAATFATDTYSVNTSYQPSLIVKWIEPTKVEVTPNSNPNYIDIGGKLQLKAKVKPSNAVKAIKWSTNDSAIATVNTSGVVTAKKTGTTYITATSAVKSGISHKVKVKVIAPASVTVSTPSTSMDINATMKLTAAVNPSTLKNRTVTWSSSNTSVATVDTAGTVKGKAAGTTKITARSKLDNRIVGSVSITVKAPNVVMTPNYTPLTLGNTITLSAEVKNVTNRNVTWRSNNTQIATVDSSGKVTPIKKGIVTITATSVQDTSKKSTCMIQVIGTEEKRLYGIDGVYAPTGNFSQTFADMTVPSALGDITVSRTYNSLEAANASTVGKGFQLNYQMRMVMNHTANVYIIMPDSSWWHFIKDSNGNFTAQNCRAALTKDTQTNGYVLTTLDNMKYGFTSNGYPSYVSDAIGNRINIITDGNGKITNMNDASGLSLAFLYNGGNLTSITDNVTGKKVTYQYDSKNNLQTVTDMSGYKMLYHYTNGMLDKITSSSNNGQLSHIEAEITYYSNAAYAGLVEKLKDGQGLQLRYDYSQKAGKNEVTVFESEAEEEDMEFVKTTQVFHTNYALKETKTMRQDEDSPSDWIISEKTKQEVNAYHQVTRTEDINENVTTNAYDGKGNLIKVTYPDNTFEEYTYDNNTNDMIKHVDQYGLTTMYQYTNHKLTKVEKMLDGVPYVINKYEYYPDTTYPIKGLVEYETGPLGNNSNRMHYQYDFTKVNNIAKTVKSTKIVNGDRKTTESKYDKLGRLVEETDPSGFKTVHTYHTTTGLLTSTVVYHDSVKLKTETHTYNDIGEETENSILYHDREVKETNQYQYDSENGNLLSETHEDHTQTKYQYDINGNVIKETEYAAGKTAGAAGQELGSTESEFDELGRNTEEITNDEKGANPTSETVTTQYYNETKLYVTETVDEYGGTTVTKTGYDGRLYEEKSANGLVQTNTYYGDTHKNKGRLQRETYKNKDGQVLKWTEYEYDDWGRITRQTSSLDSAATQEVRYTYDIAGNVLTELVKVASNQYKKKEYEYDAWNHCIRTTEYEGFFHSGGAAIGNVKAIHAQTAYDWDGQVLIEARGLDTILPDIELYNLSTYGTRPVVKYYYNDLRQLAEKTDALGKTETYKYDYAGRLVYTKDRNGVEHTVKYNDMGQVAEEKDGAIVKTYTYGLDGNAETTTQTENGVQTIIRYEYNGLGAVEKESDNNGTVKFFYEQPLERTFQEDGVEIIKVVGKKTEEIITINGVERQHVEKEYDQNGQLLRVSDSGMLSAEYTYDLLGQLKTTTQINGTTEQIDYNMAGLIKTVTNKKEDTLLSKTEYTYYSDGSEHTKVDTVGAIGSREYTYDGRGQLIKAVMVNNGIPTQQEYEFDLQGNRTSLKVTVDGTTTVTAYEYDKNNRLKKETVADQTPKYYNYDNNGNMTSKSIGSSSTSLTLLTYDTLNRMTSHSVLGGAMDTYTYYPDNIRKSKDRNGSMTQIWMNDEIALDARGDAVQSSYIHGNKLISSAYGWYLYNAHGDVTALTDDVGEVTYNYEYDPYGVEISEPGASESMNPYRYCGEYFDAETGFTYLRARYYDAKIGRFISEDPALDGLNWYAYCGNDPVNKIDPSGESAVAIKVGVDVAIIVVDLLSKAAAATASVYLVDVVYNKVTGKKEYYYSSSKEVAKPQPGPKPSMKPKRKGKAKVDKARKLKGPIARRDKSNTRKKAYEKAKKAGGGKEPRHDPNGHGSDKRPHFHPNVKNPTKPGQPSPHDHYYYPR